MHVTEIKQRFVDGVYRGSSELQDLLTISSQT